MKKLFLTICFVFTSVMLMAQTYGIGLKNPREAYNALDSKGKLLLEKCSNIAGVPIDSMIGVDSVYNTFKYVANQYNVKVIVVSDHQINNYETNQHTSLFSDNVIIEDYYGKSLEKPMFMVFMLKNNEGMEITLQMYY